MQSKSTKPADKEKLKFYNKGRIQEKDLLNPKYNNVKTELKCKFESEHKTRIGNEEPLNSK
jgi:hypothetical protein